MAKEYKEKYGKSIIVTTAAGKQVAEVAKSNKRTKKQTVEDMLNYAYSAFREDKKIFL